MSTEKGFRWICKEDTNKMHKVLALAKAGYLEEIVQLLGESTRTPKYFIYRTLLEIYVIKDPYTFYGNKTSMNKKTLPLIKFLVENLGIIEADTVLSETAKEVAYKEKDLHKLKDLYKQIIQYSLQKGAILDAAKPIELYVAFDRLNFDSKEQLSIARANVDRKDCYDGKTLLHIASERDNIELAKLFLNSGADVNAKDKNCNTPLDHAKTLEMKELLQKAIHLQ